jgi:2-keto-4-pentenoate hydratase/2-oxohepta-3-ene-1,7-dioic acid hydratase in catechol pathway
MIFRIPETIAYISSVMTLEPGDIIAMGTPEGVGMARGICLKPGDRLRGEIEGLGTLENVVALEE